MTPPLFHGPEARNRAVQWSFDTGRPASSPLGDDGLKVNDSRRIVDLANQGGVGDKPPTLVVGPLDRATVEASDALLKTLEDLAEGPLRIALWADYLIGVPLTIRSRTRATYCPGNMRLTNGVKQAAEKIIQAVRTNKAVASKTLSALEEHDPEILLDAMVQALDPEIDQELWSRLRPALGSKWVSSKTAFLDMVLPT